MWLDREYSGFWFRPTSRLKAFCRYVWPRPWGPTYRKSYAICIATAGCTIGMCCIFKLHLAHLNRRLDKDEVQKGVKDKGFRYLT